MKHWSSLYFLSLPRALLFQGRSESLAFRCASCEKHTALNSDSLPPRVTWTSLVPSEELACARLLGKCENPPPTTLLGLGSLGLAVSRGDVFQSGFLPLRSHPLNQVQMATWSDSVPSKARSQRNSAQPCPGLSFPPGELWEGGGHSPGCHHPEAPQLSSFLTSGLLKLSESGAILSNPKGECISLHQMDEHRCRPLARPAGLRGLGTAWEDTRENEKHLSVRVSRGSSSLSLGYAGWLSLLQMEQETEVH